MDLSELRTRVAASVAVAPVGGRTQWEVGGDLEPGRPIEEVAPPAARIHHDPGDLTVTVDAGVPVGRLSAALAEQGQECPLDPLDPGATVGGVIACGLSGHRRLSRGPLRDLVLGVRFVTADGRLVKGGGPTVKNVSGYDVARLMVGSLGTLGIVVEVTLRCFPLPRAATWARGEGDPFALRDRLFRPSSLLWDGADIRCLLEGHPADVEAELAGGGLESEGEGVAPPPIGARGTYRGRISVRPGRLPVLADRLARVEGLCWVAEVGVGTVHVGADDPATLSEARHQAEALAGWMLRVHGAGVDAFGRPLPNAGVTARLREALDPTGKLNPGRLPR